MEQWIGSNLFHLLKENKKKDRVTENTSPELKWITLGWRFYPYLEKYFKFKTTTVYFNHVLTLPFSHNLYLKWFGDLNM